MPRVFSFRKPSFHTASVFARGRDWRDLALLFLPVGIVAVAISVTALAVAGGRGVAAKGISHEGHYGFHEGHDGFSTRARLIDAPRTFLWAWERPEDLTYIDVRRVGVAYLAGTIWLSGDEAVMRPRMQPLRVPPATSLIAVVRLESDAQRPAAFSSEQRKQIVESVRRLITGHDLAAVQIDFDARASERAGYRALMEELRRTLDDSQPIGQEQERYKDGAQRASWFPPNRPNPGRLDGARSGRVLLQMTALASWCMEDGWIETMPVDEVVPMFFSMGADTRAVNDVLRSGLQVQRGVCGSSVGLATYEQSDASVAGKRVYWFTSGGWTRDKVEAAEKR